MELMFTSAEEMDAWDNAVRSILMERKQELNMSDAKLGEKAFTGIAKMPRGKVQYLFVGQGSGEKRKLQQFRTTDLMNLCEALRISFYDVIEKANAILKDQSKKAESGEG